MNKKKYTIKYVNFFIYIMKNNNHKLILLCNIQMMFLKFK